MASISLLLIGFLAALWGVIHFNDKLKNFTGSIVVIVIGLVGLYVGVTFSDVVLSNLGFETGFPNPERGYYLYQSFIYIFLGAVMLGAFFYLLKDTKAKEVSHAFWWIGTVMMIAGGLDLIIETFVRVEILEFKLMLGIVLLIALLIMATKYKDRLFERKEKPRIPKEGE